ILAQMVLSPGKQGDRRIEDAKEGEGDERESGGVPKLEQTVTDAGADDKDSEIEEVRGFDGDNKAQNEGGKRKKGHWKTTYGENEKEPAEDFDGCGCAFRAGKEAVV